MVSSSSASQSDAAARERGEASGGGVERYAGGGDGFLRIMARFHDLALEVFQSLAPILPDWVALLLTLWWHAMSGRATLLRVPRPD